jgi:hypothetical protein
MLAGALVAVFWVVIALIGALSALVCVLGFRRGT